MNMQNILAVKNLMVSFDGRAVIRNVSFELAKAECIAVIGPNGSGKTVLLRALLGTIPSEGNIVWGEEARIGYVPQKIDADRHLPLNLLNLLCAKINILGLTKSELKVVSDTVGLTPAILKTPIGHLSGGQFQKALIAFALLGNPNVILFDEPTASLDQLTEEHVYELVDELRERRGLSVILVSHDLSIVSQYATKVLCLNKERVYFGPPHEALREETLQKLYGAPHKYHHHDHH